MDLEFKDKDLEAMAFDPNYRGRWSAGIVKEYRFCLHYFLNAPDRRAIYHYPGFRLEKLKGKKKDVHSLRLNDQYRLILQFQRIDNREAIYVLGIEDYHK